MRRPAVGREALHADETEPPRVHAARPQPAGQERPALGHHRPRGPGSRPGPACPRALHAARAGLRGRKYHPDQLEVAARREFLNEALAAMARTAQARILTLDVAGTPVTAQLVLDRAERLPGSAGSTRGGGMSAR